jgi:Ser/Thr protein kinase RdoA (MazF antagonist)
MTSLLAQWGLPPDVRLTPADHGTNNQTMIASAGSRRFVLRISQNLTADQVRAEHRLLARLRQAGLPFAVPEPQPTLTGEDLVETGAGSATLTAWLPGVRPRLSGEASLRRIGRAVGLLSRALAPVPLQDAPHNWRTAVDVHPEVPDVGDLCRDLRAAGVDLELTRMLESRAADADGSPVTGLPLQIVHGDLAASNLLADERTGEITAVLDFELAGLDARVHDFMNALKQCGALEAPGWRQQVAAMAEGYASAQELTGTEAAAVPGLLSEGLVASVLWRAGRWRRGQAELAEVTDRLRGLERTSSWLADCGPELADLLTTWRSGGSV